MSFLRSRLLGGVGFLPAYAPENGSGSGGAAAAPGDGGAAPASPPAAGAAPASAPAAAAAPAAPAAAAASLAAGGAGVGGDKGGQQQQQASPQQLAQWLSGAPADWREQLAGDDKGFLNQLKRHTTPQSAFDWLRKTSLKLSAGELKEVKQAPGPEASEEEKAAWRKEQGLPDKADGYLGALKLPEGFVLGEADKPLANSFAEVAHANGWSQAQYDQAVSWYFNSQAQQAQAREVADNDFHIESQQRLIEAMGNDFKPNMNVLSSFWKEYGGAEIVGANGNKSTVADAVLTARTADGRVLGDIPEVAMLFAKVGRELNPAATLLPPGGQQDLKGVQGRKAEIEKMMYVNGKQNPAYWGNATLQAEYRDLITAEQTMQKRAG